jgi:hypothetical protein
MQSSGKTYERNDRQKSSEQHLSVQERDVTTSVASEVEQRKRMTKMS